MKPLDNKAIAAVKQAVAALPFAGLSALAAVLAEPGSRRDEKRLIAVLAGWSGWAPPRPVKYNPFRAPAPVLRIDRRPFGVDTPELPS